VLRLIRYRMDLPPCEMELVKLFQVSRFLVSIAGVFLSHSFFFVRWVAYVRRWRTSGSSLTRSGCRKVSPLARSPWSSHPQVQLLFVCLCTVENFFVNPNSWVDYTANIATQVDKSASYTQNLLTVLINIVAFRIIESYRILTFNRIWGRKNHQVNTLKSWWKKALQPQC